MRPSTSCRSTTRTRIGPARRPQTIVVTASTSPSDPRDRDEAQRDRSRDPQRRPGDRSRSVGIEDDEAGRAPEQHEHRDRLPSGGTGDHGEGADRRQPHREERPDVDEPGAPAGTSRDRRHEPAARLDEQHQRHPVQDEQRAQHEHVEQRPTQDREVGVPRIEQHGAEDHELEAAERERSQWPTAGEPRERRQVEGGPYQRRPDADRDDEEGRPLEGDPPDRRPRLGREPLGDVPGRQGRDPHRDPAAETSDHHPGDAPRHEHRGEATEGARGSRSLGGRSRVAEVLTTERCRRGARRGRVVPRPGWGANRPRRSTGGGS